MTACGKLFRLLDELLDEKKTIDQMGDEICDMVKKPRLKIIRLIKQHKGAEYLKENAEWLRYQVHEDENKLDKNVQLTEGDHHNKATVPDEKNVGSGNIKKTTEPETVRPQDPKQPEIQKPDPRDEFIDRRGEPKESTPEEMEEERNYPSACRIYIPDTDDISICINPKCGCGYSEINEKWYTKAQIKELKKAEQDAEKEAEKKNGDFR